MWSLAVIAGTLLGYVALETWRPGLVPPAIAFTAAGVVVGTEGLGWVELTPNTESLQVLAEATLAFVLFSDAPRIDVRALRDGYALPARLLGIGLPLTIVAGTLAAALVLPQLTLAEAAVLAIVLAATDAALGQAVVTDERLPESIRQGLNVESGLNDGLGVPALVIALTLAQSEAHELGGTGVAEVVSKSIGYGVLMGVVAGLAAALVHRRAVPTGDAVLVVESNIPHANTIVDATALTVTASVVLHGLTARPLTDRYARLLRRRTPREGIEASEPKVRVPPGGTRWPRATTRP